MMLLTSMVYPPIRGEERLREGGKKRGDGSEHVFPAFQLRLNRAVARAPESTEYHMHLTSWGIY